MKVDIRAVRGDDVETVGSIELRDGRAVATTPEVEWIADPEQYVVVEPGSAGKVRLTPDDGEAFIRALPFNLRGTYLWATLPQEDE